MANRLKKMLTEEMVRLDPPLLSTPEEVIEYCGNILVENKKAKAGYVKEMIDSYQRFGPYMVFGLCSRSEGCQMMGILSFCRI